MVIGQILFSIQSRPENHLSPPSDFSFPVSCGVVQIERLERGDSKFDEMNAAWNQVKGVRIAAATILSAIFALGVTIATFVVPRLCPMP